MREKAAAELQEGLDAHAGEGGLLIEERERPGRRLAPVVGDVSVLPSLLPEVGCIAVVRFSRLLEAPFGRAAHSVAQLNRVIGCGLGVA